MKDNEKIGALYSIHSLNDEVLKGDKTEILYAATNEVLNGKRGITVKYALLIESRMEYRGWKLDKNTSRRP